MDNPYYTHREYLENELEKLIKQDSIRCIEFGTGDGSAEIFEKFAKEYQKIEITSFESDASWLKTVKEKYERDNYSFHQVENWSKFLDSYQPDGIYDLIFVDQSPWEARIDTINKMLDYSKVIILHDYDYYNKNSKNPYVNDDDSFFKQNYGDKCEIVSYYDILPPTLVMYNKSLNK
jgi:hypothetical protein